MAGLIARLFGGKSRPPDPNPLPGLGGVSTPPGPAGATGFPGSTSQTRTFPGRNPMGIRGDWTTIKASTNTGFDQALVAKPPQVRQHSYRGDVRGANIASPRSTPSVVTSKTRMSVEMQSTPGTFYGGPSLQTGPGNVTAGGEMTSAAVAAGGGPAANSKDTTTLWKDAQPLIGAPAPGAENVRNQIAERYRQRPGQPHTYRPAPRADQVPVNPTGQASDGNVSNALAAQGAVTVQNRFVFDGGSSLSWGVMRRMPYTGRGDGARGAELSGQRYYAENVQSHQFWNAGQGDYGIARQLGSQVKVPVGFTEPAPWTSQYYLTTDSVGSYDNPNATPGQLPQGPVMSPSSGRASNSTGRTH